ncbi:hypothetical protein I204_04390 [Kwoniella mangroviensis CBS 8886]|nr:hypothetical protein I204_04390 [Kwoniella mangroviensis CBS 8886]
MPFPYMSFRTLILMLVIPIVISKDIQWRYQQLKYHIRYVLNSIVYDFIPTIGVYTLIGCLAVPTIMFMVLFKVSSSIARILCSIFLFLSKSSNISLEEREGKGRDEEYEFQEKPDPPLISGSASSSTGSSTSTSTSGSTIISSYGPGTPNTPVNTVSIESWSYGVYLKQYPPLTVDAESDHDSEKVDDDARLEHVKEPQPTFERGGDYPYLPLRLNEDRNISTTSTETDSHSYSANTDTDTTYDDTPTTIDSGDATIAIPTREDEQQKENARIDNLLLRVKKMNIKHSKFVKRCEKESEKFNASFPGDLDIAKLRRSLKVTQRGKKGKKNELKLDLAVIHE